MKKIINGIIVCLLASTSVFAQEEKKKFFNRTEVKDSTEITNQDQIYNRPFIGFGQSKTAIGGYLEGNTNYFSEDGVSEGFSMELRRFNIFLYSDISKRIKFISELEFEHGTEEIALETALIDFNFNPSLNFRGGILLPQLGIINANHDSPKWEIIDRPLSSTTIIPTTLSEVGFGIHGKFFPGNNIISYDAYIVNGLQDGIVLNDEGKTFIPGGKSEEAFGEDNNGTPMYNGRVAFRNRTVGEFGASYYGGIYNTFALEGEPIDSKNSLHMVTLDFSTKIKKFTIQGEAVFASVDVAEDLSELYGEQQYGGFIDVIYPIIAKPVFGYKNAKVNATIRFEMLDYNLGTFNPNGINISESLKIGDEITALTFGLSFRPTDATIFRANYRRHWITDVLGNPPALLGGIQVGFATYF